MKLGKQKGCAFDDRIDLELSPTEVETLKVHFQKQAISVNQYGLQGYWRRLADYFEERYSTWDGERKKKDKEAPDA